MFSDTTRRVLLDLSVALCIVSACVSGVVIEAVSLLAFFGESATREDYQSAAISYVGLAVAVAVLGLLAQIGLRRAWWLSLVTGSGVVALLLRASQLRAEAATAEAGEYGVEVGNAILLVALPPTSWPLMVLGIAGVVALVRRDGAGD